MAAQSAVIPIPPSPELPESSDVKRPSSQAAMFAGSSSSSSVLVIDKTLASTANLVKLLPSGTVLAFEALSSSFTNRGNCYPSNRYLTAALLYVCVVSCVVFSFTDSFVGRDGKHYYGVATWRGFYVFNYDETGGGGGGGEEGDGSEAPFGNLQKYRVRALDYVHAFFSAVVFLTLAFSDSDVQGCFFPGRSVDTRQLLENLPLGAAVLSALVFVVFPTSRRGIGYTDLSSTHITK